MRGATATFAVSFIIAVARSGVVTRSRRRILASLGRRCVVGTSCAVVSLSLLFAPNEAWAAPPPARIRSTTHGDSAPEAPPPKVPVALRRTRAQILGDPKLRPHLHESRFMIVAGSGLIVFGALNYGLGAAGLAASTATLDGLKFNDGVSEAVFWVSMFAVAHGAGIITGGVFFVIGGEARRRALYRGDPVHPIDGHRRRTRKAQVRLSPHMDRQTFGFGVSGRF